MSTTAEVPVYEVGRVYGVAPGDLRIGTNVRKDTRTDAKDFAASVRARGVIVAIDAHVDEEGGLCVLRGQRRALVAAQVGTPSGTVPVRVVPAPDDADRITDQLVENLHRADMHEREARDGVEQLALLGVSVAQIVKRTALPRPVVDNALSVAGHQASKDRIDAQGMTLEQAAIFAEYDSEAVAALESAWESRWERPRLAHIAQRLRDERAERTALRAEVERVRADGLPVLDPADVTPAVRRLTSEDLRDQDGQPVPAEQWASTPGAAVVVTVDWQAEDDAATDPDAEKDDDDQVRAEPRKVYVPVWVCTDPAGAGLHHRWDGASPRDSLPAADNEDERAAREQAEQARREAESAERRRVLANNAAWRSEVVRREWLASLLARRQVPKGAEALIARAVLERQYSLAFALSNGHDLLGDLLSLRPADGGYQSGAQVAARILAQATTPAAATMRTLAAVLAAWEARSGVHTWRNPGAYDGAIMAALVGWGYPASEVEQMLTAPAENDGADEADEPHDVAAD